MALNLRKWLEVSDAYDKGGFAYYTTLPTDCIALFRNAALDLKKYNLGRAKTTFSKLGTSVADMVVSKASKRSRTQNSKPPASSSST